MGLSLLTPAIVIVVANVQNCVEVTVSQSSYKTKESLMVEIGDVGFDILAAERLSRLVIRT